MLDIIDSFYNDEGSLIKKVEILRKDEPLENLAKRRHDLKGSLRTLNLVFSSIKDTEIFHGKRGEAKLRVFRNAIEVLEKEAALIDKLYL